MHLRRRDLQRAEYYVPQVEELLGTVAAAALRRTQLLPARDAVQNNLSEPRAALTGIFLLGLEITNEQLGTALPTLGADVARALWLVDAQCSGPCVNVIASVDIRTYTT